MRPTYLSFLTVITVVVAFLTCASAQVNNAGQKPYLGWSSFSQQTIQSNFLTQANMITQSDALKASGLQDHGFVYINLDSGWQGSFDQYGRPIPNSTTFPDIKAMVDHIHANGQKAGIYWIPGIEQPAVDCNCPILGTPYTTGEIVVIPLAKGNAFAANPPNPYHDKIDFTKPGAQEYIDSIVALFSSWGFDFIKLDAVTPGSYVDDLSIDNRADVQAWSTAIAKTGRPIWLAVSWQLSQDYASVWQQWSNARRIDDDVECEGRCATLTNWPRIVLREYDDVGWEDQTSTTLGWNDMDTLDVGDGALDGLSAIGENAGWWHMAIAWEPYFLTLMWIGTIPCGFIFLITWRIARRFGGRGLAVVAFVAAVLGPVRDYRYIAIFPEWGAYAPGPAPVFAISVTYVILGILGHGTMRLVAGPAPADRLARRPWEPA